MGMNKTNPKKIPATLYDVERARREGRYEGFNGLMSMFLWVASEDFHFTDDDLEKLQQRILYYCAEIQSSRLRLSDIISALKEEHDITIELTERRQG
jgi:hypothetical protein